MRKQIITSLAHMFRYSGLNYVLRPVYGGRGVILMFHGLYDGLPPVNEGGNVSSVFFEKLLKHIKRSDMLPLSLCDVPSYLEDENPQRFVCLTFDDGYKNNLSIGAPLLERYQIPATVFVTSQGMKGELDYLWGVLEAYIAAHEYIEIQDYKASIKTLTEKRKAYLELTRKLRLEYSTWCEQIKSYLAVQGYESKSYVAEHFMNESEVLALDGYEMVDIGGHTLSHPMLSHLDEMDALEEIRSNKKDLEALLAHEVKSFAYPFGGFEACGSREYDLALRAGYKVAVTTRVGSIFGAHKGYLHALPRFGVNGAYEGLSVLNMYLSGSWRAIRTHFASPFVV